MPHHPARRAHRLPRCHQPSGDHDYPAPPRPPGRKGHPAFHPRPRHSPPAGRQALAAAGLARHREGKTGNRSVHDLRNPRHPGRKRRPGTFLRHRHSPLRPGHPSTGSCFPKEIKKLPPVEDSFIFSNARVLFGLDRRDRDFRGSFHGNRLLDLGLDVGVARAPLRDDESRHDAENNDCDRQGPGCFLKEVGRLTHAEGLVAGSKVGCQSAALRVLEKNHDGQENTRNHDQDGECDIRCLHSLLCFFFYFFYKSRKVSTFFWI